MPIDPTPYKTETVVLDGNRMLQIPFYTRADVQQCNCARYARLAAKTLFGKEYPIQPAWSMRHSTRLVASVQSNSEISALVDSGKVQPGMVLGVYWDGSAYNRPDRPYSHISLLLGKQFGKPLFLEQFVDVIQTASLLEYDECGFTIVDVMDTLL